jgi:hypothetical protein
MLSVIMLALLLWRYRSLDRWKGAMNNVVQTPLADANADHSACRRYLIATTQHRTWQRRNQKLMLAW